MGQARYEVVVMKRDEVQRIAPQAFDKFLESVESVKSETLSASLIPVPSLNACPC